METLETMETMMKKEGNTSNSRIVPAKYWTFTLNNWSKEELETLETKFLEEKIEYVIGKEEGESKTPHLQGFIKSPKKIRPIEKFKNNKIHWEKCKGSEIDNIKYCTKDNNFTTNIRIIKDKIKMFGAYEWQQKIINECDTEPDDRKINWIWEKNGNVGKTELAKHLALKYKNKVLYVNGKAADIKCAIAQMKVKPEIVIFGIPRVREGYVDYSALEEIKDGIFFSGKYESGMVLFPSPHVFILCNFPPDIDKLSKDRWNITNICKDEQEYESESDYDTDSTYN